MNDLQGTLGYSGQRGSKNLGELASGDYSTFGALIWYEELINLTLLLLTSFETILFGVGSLGIGVRCIRRWQALSTIIYMVVYDHQYLGGLVELLGLLCVECDSQLCPV